MTATYEVDDAPGAIAETSGELRFPCSASQQRCWFIQALNPNSTVLNIALRWEIKGAFSASTIEQAFQTIIDRHEILRTRFVETDGDPIQTVAGHHTFKLSVVDLTIVPETERLDQALALGILEARKPFDLARLPLAPRDLAAPIRRSRFLADHRASDCVRRLVDPQSRP